VIVLTMVEREKLNRIHLIFTCTRIDGEVMSASIWPYLIRSKF
jgi:hypothetical protein